MIQFGKSIMLIIWIICFIVVVSCCSGSKESDHQPVGSVERIYSIYLMSRGIHTGLIIPVNDISKRGVAALTYFTKAIYVDFGWGDEEVYQTSHETWCMDLRAVTVPSTSVMRVEFFPGEPENLVTWSGYTVMFCLTGQEFKKLCAFIDSGFTRDKDNRLIQTSVRSGGEVIFFRSLHTYCGFNTCNTWVADALHAAGLDVSPFMVITERGLYNELKRTGVVLKERE